MQFLVQIRCGECPDIYDRVVFIDAEDFADAAEDAELRSIRLRGQVTLLKQCDFPRALERAVYPLPEGWALVPKEPTPEMLDSTWDEVAVMGSMAADFGHEKATDIVRTLSDVFAGMGDELQGSQVQ